MNVSTRLTRSQLLLILLMWVPCMSAQEANVSSNISGSPPEPLLSRTKRNKFVQKFLEKSKASQDKVKELEKMFDLRTWPIIAWKTDADVYSIGDDGQLESSPFEALSEDDTQLVNPDIDDFSLKPASTYQAQLHKVEDRIQLYNRVFVISCFLLFSSNFLLLFVRYWLIGLSRLVLRSGLKIEFQATHGPKRQEFIYAMAFVIQEDLLDNRATRAEHGFAACINDAVVAVESYTKTKA